MFKPGDRVVCVNNDHISSLTNHKEYVVFNKYPESRYNIIIPNDDGFLISVNSNIFITKTKFRKQKLEKIINKIESCDFNIEQSNIISTDVDELAYYLYVLENDERNWNLLGFIKNKEYLYSYYDKANIIMRKEKLEKLNNI